MSQGNFSKDTVAKLRSTPLEAVLRMVNAASDPCDKLKWHTHCGVLSVNGAKFINWNRNLGGGGAIDLAMHLNNCNFKQALQWLSQHFPDSGLQQAEPLAEQPLRQLRLPQPDPGKLWQVKNYLVHNRGIPQTLLEPLLRSGTIYADQNANAVFLLLANKNPIGAELRSTTHRSWRGLCSGSRKNIGFFSCTPQHSTRGIILVESAIDAISCFALHPHHQCISTAGARPNPAWLPDLFKLGLQLYCGFDTDSTGEDSATAMTVLYPNVIRLRPTPHDWNDTLRANR